MRLIDAKLLVDEIKNIQTYKIDRDFEKLIPLHSALATIRDAPTVDMKPVVHEKWVEKWCAGLALLCADQLEYCEKCGEKSST